jgi:anti-sigma regulatory factor (Ser/Thr protein kinase)
MEAKDTPQAKPVTGYNKGTGLHLLSLPPRLDTLSDVRSFVDSLDLSALLTPERVFDLKVALSEAAANAIEHAKAKVSISLWMLSDRIVVDISNVGEFGGANDGPPSGRRRGFGLKLMVCLADEVTFVRGKLGKTTVRLTFLHNRFDVSPALVDDGPG